MEELHIFDRRFNFKFDEPVFDPTKMSIDTGSLAVLDDRFSYQVYNKLLTNWRGASAPADIQSGTLFSDSDDNKLWHCTPVLKEILQVDIDVTQGAKVGNQAVGPYLQFSSANLRIFDCNVLINEAANSKMVRGLTINQEAYDNEIFALKSSDVDHGITDITELDTYGLMKKVLADNGGVSFQGFTEVTIAVEVMGSGVIDDTTHTAAGRGYVELTAMKKSGTTRGDVGANANLAVIRNNATTRFIFAEPGDMFYDGAAPVNYDEFDDPAACHDVAVYLHSLKNKHSLSEFLKYNRQDLIDMGVITPGNFVSMKNMTALILGAIGQLYEENKRLKESLNSILLDSGGLCGEN